MGAEPSATWMAHAEQQGHLAALPALQTLTEKLVIAQDLWCGRNSLPERKQWQGLGYEVAGGKWREWGPRRGGRGSYLEGLLRQPWKLGLYPEGDGDPLR